MLKPRWHCFCVKRYSEVTASVEAVRLGFPVYLPMLPKRRIHNHTVENVSVPRFPSYLFAQFDRDRDRWVELLRGDLRQRAGFLRIMCNPEGKPSIVPDRAMAAVRAYVPPLDDSAESPDVYQPGAPVDVYIVPGVPMSGVFVGYERNRAMVKVWIFGRENIIPVAHGAIERQTSQALDNGDTLTTIRAKDLG